MWWRRREPPGAPRGAVGGQGALGAVRGGLAGAGAAALADAHGVADSLLLAAALGRLSPVEGTLLQEAIDVAVVLNALRALRG